ncbi:MAG: LAGLIDADG family homing endonuclease, partial [Halovenus sp.]
MSKQPGADELTLPIKRTDGETAEERLTDNAYYNILPARYLQKDANGDVIEQQEDLFERVAKNIALAEAVFEARKRDIEVTVTPDQLKPGHPRRDELAADVFGTGVSVDDDVETTLTEYNVNKFSYETVVPDLPADLRDHVETIASAFQEQMEQLSFMPNCVPPDSLVAANGGMKPLSEVAPGERVYDDEDGLAEVEKKYANGKKTVVEVETAPGYSVRATPEHYFRVIADDGEYEWRQVQDIGPGDVLALQKNFLDNDSERTSLELPDSGSDHGRTRGRFDPPERMTPQLAEWLGLYVGDGTARESGVRVAFDEVDNDLVDHWATLTESVFGFEPTRHARSDAACVIGQASRRDLFDFLDRNGLLKETSDTAAVPLAVLRSGRRPVATFLRGLFEADGTVGERSIELYTHSDALASQVQKLLLGLGIRSKVTEKHDGYRVTIRKNVCGRRFAERVGFLSERKTAAAERFKDVSENASSVKIPNQSERLHEWFQDSDLGLDAYRDLSQFLIDSGSDCHQEIGKGIFQRYAEEYPELRESPVADLVSRDQIYEEVSSVTEVGMMAVEDMKVPRRNTYVVEGFVSHNSPTLMNAGDELQQLSACFVDSPADDIDDIHQTAKEAAQVFQCLTADARVHVEGNGVVSIADVEPGDAIRQRTGDGYTFGTVEEVHAYDDAPTKTVVTEGNIGLTGTPNHRLLVDGEWTQIEDIEPGDTVSVRLGWISDDDETDSLAGVDVGAQWSANRTVSNEEIADLHADGLSDYEIAERLDTSPSTVQRRRNDELDLPANGDGGRSPGRSFDETAFRRLYEIGHTDTEIAAELDIHDTTVRGHRAAQSLEANGTAVKGVTQPTELSAELAELVGIWVGDGSVHEDGIRFHANRDDVLNRIDSLSRSLFDTGIDYTWSDGCYEAVIHSREIKRWWLSQFGDAKESSADARVPDCIWQADHDGIYAFLRGLFSTDGTLGRSEYPRLYSASEDLVDETLQLLLGVGIPATKWSWQHENRDYHTVAPTDELGISRFAESVGFVDTRADEMLAELDRTTTDTTTGTLESETVWEQEVVAVEDGGETTVYDVTVEGNHEYVASSVVSHNSGGGMGYAFWRLRPYGDPVGSTGGIASGPITFMRTYDQLCETIAQGGARRGAQMGVMRVSHPDVIQFIHAKNKDVSLANTLRLNDPDDFTHNSFAEALEEARDLIDDEGRVPEHLRNAVEGHLSNFNISVGITDRFMEAVKNDEMYTFTNPRTGEPHVATEQTEELYSMFGLGEYVDVGEVLSVPATELWDRIIEGAHENGEPGVIYLERVNKKHSFDVADHPEHRILATNPCVTGDTLVSTENGLVPAEELYDQGVARDVVVDGRLSEDRVKEASSVYKTGKKDVYRLMTEEGYELRLTADHRVMTDDGWVKARNLDAGDTVHIQNRKGEFGQHGSAAEGRVLGWLVGDGHLKDGEERAVLNFYDEDAEISEQFAGDVNEIVREPTGNANYKVGVSEITRDDDYRGAQAIEQRIRSARLYEYAERLGSVENKLQIPDAVMRGSEEMARGFLRAVFSADGHVEGTQEKGFLVRLTSTELDLLKDVQRLLTNFGIRSQIYRNREESGKSELPDGSGDTKEYETRASHQLCISSSHLIAFEEEVGFLLDYKNEELADALDSYERGPYKPRFEATVESVERDGHEAVYDLTEPDTNSFVANGLVVHNCGEQPLEEYEACNLGHINLSTLAAEDAPDWRVWQGEHADAYDTEAGAIEAFIAEAIDWEEFDRRIELGTRFLENVVTMSDFPVTEIEQKVREMRKIGLGIMGLAQLYIQLGMRYGGDAANETARQLMIHINHQSKWTSHELAEERGSFAEWDNSKYAQPAAYADWFEHHTGLDAEEWDDGFPIRNHNTTTIAPTGCVEENSLVSTDEGLQPIKDLDETTAEFEQWDDIEVGVSTDGGTKTATAVYDNGFADVRRIETEGGFSIAATPNHRFRTITANGEYVWREADDFEPGDRILLQRGTFDSGNRAALDTSERDNYYRNTDEDITLPAEMTPDLAEFLGYFMGDGYVHDGVGVKLVVESAAEELDEYLRTLGESLFGVAPTVEARDTRHMLTFGGRHLPRYFEDNGWTKDDGNEGQGAASAFIPEEVLRGDEETVKSFLRGLFEADGTASRKVELSTVSSTLANQVQTLLLSLGCVFVRNVIETEEMEDHYGDRPRHSLRGANKQEDKRFLEAVGFITKSTELELTAQSYRNHTYPPGVVDILRDVDGYQSVSKPVKNRVNQSPINGAVSRKLVRDVEAETGETVRIDGRRLTDFYAATVDTVTEETAYTKDISVPSNNTYIANGFVTHNTTSMVGNTTGGCEPIYNVAYYKNVSDDVQGDEMLVEFDDYFLRTLEANDIDVEAVKREAQEQMAANEFDGVDGLTTVPDAIGELFVVTGDLSAKDHAGVQTACQEGVDSAISKCLEEGTLVQTDSGVRPIESFADSVPEPGEFVDVEEDVTIDGVPVQSQYYAGEKDATRVRVDNGTELVGATESHKVLTPDGWRVLGDLEPGDYVIGRQTESHGDGNAPIAFPRGGAAMADGGATLAVGGPDRSVHEKDVTVPSNMSPRLARFLGMYAADGSAIDDRYSIEISTASERVRDEARDLFEELFGREPSIDLDTRGGEERDTVYGVHLNSRPVWEFVTSLCGSGSYDKDVPREVLQGSPEEKLAFVTGITLDGYVTDQSLVVYGGMSRDLADGAAELLRSFGVPKVYVGRKWVDESDAYAYQVHVTNDAQELVTPIEPHKRVDRFDQRYRVYVPQDRVDKTAFDSRSQEYYAARTFESRNRNYMFDTTAEDLGITDAPPLYEVTDVEDAGTREMYDIELAGPHEYAVGGVVSHNTVNAPNDSTLADAKEVFEYIYDHGGKGVTYYRDG